MKTKSLILSLAILVLLMQPALNLAGNVKAEEQSQTAVRILLVQNGKLAVGEIFTVNVLAENCVDVYAVQVDIHYDPAVLKVVDILPGSVSLLPLLVSNESSIFDPELNMTYNGDYAYGKIYYVASASGDFPGISGGALLFTVTFKVVSDGSSSIELIRYPGGGSPVGTYFMTPHLVNGIYQESVPGQLYSATYGQATSLPLSSPSTTSDDKGQVLSAAYLPYLLPFAALFLFVIRRKITKKTPNQ
jgi:hypothetical protein